MRAAVLAAAAIAGGPALAEPDAELGQRLFAAEAVPPCGVCHTLAAAGTAGAIGPVLDELRPDAAQVRAAVAQGVGVMPAYAGQLTEEEIDAIVAFVAEAARAR